DGGHDAAAGRGDLLIRLAGDAALPLVGAVAGEDEVRVAVHQAGDDGPAAEVDRDGARRLRRQVARRPQPGDTLALEDDGSVGDDAELAQRRAGAAAFVGGGQASQLA